MAERLKRKELSFYALFPSVYKKELEESEDFQTSQQHEDRAEPFGQCRNVVVVVHRSYLTETGS